MTSFKPTQRDIKQAIAMYAPDQNAEVKLSFMQRYKPGVFTQSKRPRKKRQKPEEALQEMVCQWLDTQPRLLYHANNPQIITGKMTPQKMGYLASLKRRGFKKGVSDLEGIFKGRNGLVFWAAELKSLDGVTSDEQADRIKAIEAIGGFGAICRSLSEVQALLQRAGY